MVGYQSTFRQSLGKYLSWAQVIAFEFNHKYTCVLVI